MKDFNPSRLSEIADLEEWGEQGLVDDIIRDFFENWNSLYTSMKLAGETSDFTVLERKAHSLKSSSILIGMELASNTALSIEELAREKQYAPELVEELQVRILKGQSVIKSFSQNQSILSVVKASMKISA